MEAVKSRKDRLVINLNQIIERLDNQLQKMNQSSNELTGYLDQEKAIHDIRLVTKKIKRMAWQEDSQELESIEYLIYDTEKVFKLTRKIDEELAKLDTILLKKEKLSQDKRFVAEQKTMEAIKLILSKN